MKRLRWRGSLPLAAGLPDLESTRAFVSTMKEEPI